MFTFLLRIHAFCCPPYQKVCNISVTSLCRGYVTTYTSLGYRALKTPVCHPGQINFPFRHVTFLMTE